MEGKYVVPIEREIALQDQIATLLREKAEAEALRDSWKKHAQAVEGNLAMHAKEITRLTTTLAAVRSLAENPIAFCLTYPGDCSNVEVPCNRHERVAKVVAGALTPADVGAKEEKPLNDIPRRIRLDKMTPTELAITDVMRAVETLPADERLTEAVVLLSRARDKVADYVDEAERLGAGKGK